MVETDDELEVQNTWIELFKKLLNEVDKEEVEQNCALARPHGGEEQESTLEEITKIIKILKNKSEGSDELPAEAIKHGTWSGQKEKTEDPVDHQVGETIQIEEVEQFAYLGVQITKDPGNKD
ncbi:hypothetical protein ILUMI_18326 [Ignelater luminosus]|uniref:Uncharacterized protein n=1 Tax=Ignelater luminosus TaxID=2038154 RepID=A0A8K0G706_IGNLU|nr:hypothetical protein ILUMI_18326 [Ignelater luminosus]